MKCQILFQGKNKKIFQNVSCKWMLCHFEIFFLFFPENKNLFFGEIIISLASSGELAQRVIKVKVQGCLTVILKNTCEIYK